MAVIGIRREDKNEWERRVAITPDDVRELIEKHGIKVIVQPSSIRAFTDDEYKEAGAEVKEDLSEATVIFGVKEMPVEFFEPQKTYVFFSHTIKGQRHNMPMLKRLMDLKDNLIDYEKMTDEKGRRVVFFGRFAGLAGMTDTLWALGRRLEALGIETPFSKVQQAYKYFDVKHLKEELSAIGKEVEEKGLPENLTPLVIGIAGYGNVSRGAQEILDLFPVKEITPDELLNIDKIETSNRQIYKVIFKEEHIVEPIDADAEFDLMDYYQHPEKYRSVFEKYLPFMTVLVNAIYWDERYPRLLTKEKAKEMYGGELLPKLLVIGDISCDIEGAIEVTVKATDPGNPVYVYDVEKGEPVDGFDGKGPLILAVDNLPCELPRDSSEAFSHALKPYVPEIATADYSVEFDELKLSPVVKRAIIVYHGELTEDYRYLLEHLKEAGVL